MSAGRALGSDRSESLFNGMGQLFYRRTLLQQASLSPIVFGHIEQIRMRQVREDDHGHLRALPVGNQFEQDVEP